MPALVVVLLWGSTAVSAADSDEIIVHSSVDQRDSTARSILELYRAYVLHRPDSIQADNPFWCRADKQEYHDFDFTRAFIAAIPPTKTEPTKFRYYVTSIQKEGEAFAIRVSISANKYIARDRQRNTDNMRARILLYATRENGDWKLCNAFRVLTQGWHSATSGKIRCFFPPGFEPDLSGIQANSNFCDSVADFLQTAARPGLDIYLCPQETRLYHTILGIEHGYPMDDYSALPAPNLIVLEAGTPLDPRLLVRHVAAAKNVRNTFVLDGLATWLGAGESGELSVLLRNFSEYFTYRKNVTFESLLREKHTTRDYPYRAAAALVCKMAYEQAGRPGLQALLTFPEQTTAKELKARLETLLQTDDLAHTIRSAAGRQQ